jgi:zona occludens toxin
MSIKIHHGPNGSFKTSGALQDDAVRAIKAGRIVITNIRGFTLARVMDVLPDVPDTVDVINLSLESTEDLERMRSWWHWAPRGAFVIFDETQLVFPKMWKEKDLDKYDFPGGSEAAKEADRPINWLDAWTRHRHWNWDVVLTTPNIRYIRDDIRLTCEKAYLHANLGVIGIKGRYKEAMHDAQENKPPQDGKTIVEVKKIKPETFKLYESTATGTVTDTTAGKNIFLSPKVLLLLVFIAGVVFFASRNGVPSVLSGNRNPAAPTSTSKSPAPLRGPAAAASDRLGGGGLGAGSLFGPGARLDHPLKGFQLQVIGSVEGLYGAVRKQMTLFSVTTPEGSQSTFTSKQLADLGYVLRMRTACVAEVFYKGALDVVFCAGVKSDV